MDWNIVESPTDEIRELKNELAEIKEELIEIKMIVSAIKMCVGPYYTPSNYYSYSSEEKKTILKFYSMYKT